MAQTRCTVSDDKKTLIVERTFSATKERVWQAYSDPKKFAKWWGPHGWRTEIIHMDFTDGGYRHFAMTCVDPAQTEWYGHTSWGERRSAISNRRTRSST